MNDLQKQVISLVKSALTGIKADNLGELNEREIYNIAMKHQILPLVYYGIINSRLKFEMEIMQKIERSFFTYIAIDRNQLNAISELSEKFSENKIDYSLLKGSALKYLYPKTEMRTMGDADILIRVEQYEKIASILLELGYIFKEEVDHTFVWKKPNVLELELHKKLIPESNKDYYLHFKDIWSKLTPIYPQSFEYVLTKEDEYIFLFAHFAKHYRGGGVGIRQLVDIWLFMKKYDNIDNAYLKRCLEKIGLYEFYLNILELLAVWFDDAENTEKTNFITHVIFNNGVFGNYESNLVSNAIKNNDSNNYSKSRFKRMFELVFLPYSGMCIKYPILKKLPFFLPIMWVVRAFSVLMFKRKKIAVYSGDFKRLAPERIKERHDALKYVGLDFGKVEGTDNMK